MEANKIASLMRRRENAKQIPADLLLSDYHIDPRGYPPARIPGQNPSTDRFAPTAANLFVPKLPAHSNEAAKLGYGKTGAAAQSRPVQLAIGAGRSVIPLPPRNHKFGVQTPQSRKALVRRRPVNPGSDAREFGILRHPPLRVHIGSENRGRYSISPVGAHSLKSTQRARTLRNQPVKGTELRVSASAGFRLPEPVRPAMEPAKPGPVAMPFSKQAQEVTPLARLMDTAPRAAGRQVKTLEMVYQAPPMKSGSTSFTWPSAIESAACEVRNTDGEVRSASLRWVVGDPLPPGLRPHNNGAGFHRAEGSWMVARQAAAALNSSQRFTVVAFEPQDNAFEYTPRSLHGSLVGSLPFGAPPASRPKAVAAPGPQAPAIEEHFGNGWTNWLGGVEDWKLDIAGVRTGSLALFGPSIELEDYDLEFLARIEHTSVNWVYRAHDFNEYYKASIAVAAGGGFTFTRTTVSGGTDEPAATVSVPAAGSAARSPGGKTAINVHMRLRGNEFALYLDGKAVETWTDDRFPIGGIGFAGTADDRARLYWVRLTPAGTPTKENRKQ